MFDITKRDTFTSLESQIKEFRNQCAPEVKENIVLVGNKADLENER